ncbi:MAG TPA: sigma-70 family RNA polymerase sigma factor, partial [Pirellulales bacterium]
MAAVQADSQQTKQLLECAAKGDRQAFDRLFAKHRPELRNLISLRMDFRLRKRLDPSDIVQETQMIAYRRLHDYLERGPMPFQLWLRKTAQQRLVDAQRMHFDRRRRSLHREEGALSRSSRLVARNFANSHPNVLEKLARRELERRIAGAVDNLPAVNREVVVMRNVEGLSFDEIAVVLEMQPPAVRQRYGR